MKPETTVSVCVAATRLGDDLGTATEGLPTFTWQAFEVTESTDETQVTIVRLAERFEPRARTTGS